MKLLMNTLSELYCRIIHMKKSKQLLKLIENGDDEGLRNVAQEIADYVEYEMSNTGEEEKIYLTYWIAAHKDIFKGLMMLRAFKVACSTKSQYHWHEIMKVMGYSMMRGAVESQNIKVLEQAMCHVDEYDLYEITLDLDDDNPVVIWYDENFVSM